MTIFPTHKTELKTKLPRQEILERLESNNIYTIGFYYKLKETGKDYILNPIRKERGRNIFTPVVNVKIAEKTSHTAVSLSFQPLKVNTIGFLISSLLFFAASVGISVFDIVNTGFSIGNLLTILVGVFVYIFFMLMFSFEVLSIRKQIEEHIEAESIETPEEEMSKLQKWYEKDREPFKFRNK